jgi:integrase
MVCNRWKEAEPSGDSGFAPSRPIRSLVRSGGPDRSSTGGVTGARAHYLVERSYRPAGLTGWAMIHALRHTFATRLAEDGAPPPRSRRSSATSRSTTSQGYIDATANATRQAARANRTYRPLRGIVPRQSAEVVTGQPELG